jgi:hypothetical protein
MLRLGGAVRSGIRAVTLHAPAIGILVAVVLVSAGWCGQAGENVGYILQPPYIGDEQGPVLFVVEENHAALRVQTDVQHILESLAAILDVHTVLVEGTCPSDDRGAMWPIDYTLLFDSGPPEYRSAVASAWFECGLLSGIEMAQLCSEPQQFRIYGVEDAEARDAHDVELSVEGFVGSWLRSGLDLLLADLNAPDMTVSKLLYQPDVETYLSELPMVLDAVVRWEAANTAVNLEDGLPLDVALTEMQTRVRGGAAMQDALRALEGLCGATQSPISASIQEQADARGGVYNAVVEEARAAGMDTEVEESLLDAWRESVSLEDAALDARHPWMIANALAAIEDSRADAGVLVVGAGHTALLETALQDRNITHLVVTPASLTDLTAYAQESGWYSRNRDLETGWIHTPLAGWLLGYKPGLVTASPRHREALSLSIALMQIADAVMLGNSVSADTAAIESVTVEVEAPDDTGYAAIVATGPKGRRLRLEVPGPLRDGPLGLAPEDAKQMSLLIHDLLAPGAEVGAGDPLRAGAEAAIRLYEGGSGVTAAIGFRRSEDEQVVRLVPPTRPDLHLRDLSREYEEVIGTREGFFEAVVSPEVRLERNGELVSTLLRHMAECGAALGGFGGEAFPVVLQFDDSVAKMRNTNFNLIWKILQAGSWSSISANVLFVQSAFQEDRLTETPLGKTLCNLHAYGPSDREIAVILAPSPDITLNDWESHFFAQTLVEQWACPQVEARRLYLQEYGPSIRQMVDRVGKENALFPTDARDMQGRLAELLEDTPTASITITLLTHTDNDGSLCIAFPDGPEALDAFLYGIDDLQDSGVLPSATSLEFNVLACEYGIEGAEYTLGMLGSRLVLATPYSVGLLEASRFHDCVAARMQEGLPLHEAYLGAIQEIVDQVRGAVPDLWDVPDFLWVPGLYSVDTEEDSTGVM